MSFLQEPKNVDWLRMKRIDYYESNWNSVSSLGVAWDALKAVLRGRIIQYTAFLKNKKI